jgi:predicted metal-dependent enzyme (double-stranded beta helix superfamily)
MGSEFAAASPSALARTATHHPQRSLTAEQRAGNGLFTLDERRGCFVEMGDAVNRVGEVSGVALPPGDIHLVRNGGDRTMISIHIYGTQVSSIGSSVRRSWDISHGREAAAPRAH